jgi:tRNA(Ile)-lysidine synthase
MSLLERVQQTVVEQGLFGAGDALVAGVSGGADSTALAHLLALLAPRLGARLVGLAHLNHQLRPEAVLDEAACRALAARLDLPIDVGPADIRAEARARKTSIEDAARTVRYTFLNEAAAARGATRVAVGHTRNDQAETVLLRLARGAGPAGLAGIHPRAGAVVRPLLEVRRRDVEAWLVEQGWAWREDESNQDRSIPRNAVRHDVLPRLVRTFGEGVVDVLARQAALSRDDAEWFDLVATETAGRLVLEEEGALVIEQAALDALHPAIGRRVVLSLLRRVAGSERGTGRRSLGGGAFVGFEHVEAVLALNRDGGDRRTRRGALDLPGQRVSCRQGRLHFQVRAADPGRGGRRRGRGSVHGVAARAEARGVPPDPIGPAAVSNLEGESSRPAGLDGEPRTQAGNARAGIDRGPHAGGGPKCAEGVSLEGHAPKGGRG